MPFSDSIVDQEKGKEMPRKKDSFNGKLRPVKRPEKRNKTFLQLLLIKKESIYRFINFVTKISHSKLTIEQVQDESSERRAAVAQPFVTKY